jgi:MFS family permease
MIYGFIADKRYITAINLNTFSVLLSTLSLMFYFVLQYTFATHAIFSVVFAIGIGNKILLRYRPCLFKTQDPVFFLLFSSSKLCFLSNKNIQAGMNSLTTMYLCDLVGLKLFSNATGIVNLFRGFGCFLGPFLAGKLNFVFDNFVIKKKDL